MKALFCSLLTIMLATAAFADIQAPPHRIMVRLANLREGLLTFFLVSLKFLTKWN